MKIARHCANGCFNWLIPGHHSVNRSTEAISILSEKHRRFTFVHPVYVSTSKNNHCFLVFVGQQTISEKVRRLIISASECIQMLTHHYPHGVDKIQHVRIILDAQYLTNRFLFRKSLL